jgi:hypothetical protein
MYIYIHVKGFFFSIHVMDTQQIQVYNDMLMLCKIWHFSAVKIHVEVFWF